MNSNAETQLLKLFINIDIYDCTSSLSSAKQIIEANPALCEKYGRLLEIYQKNE